MTILIPGLIINGEYEGNLSPIEGNMLEGGLEGNYKVSVSEEDFINKCNYGFTSQESELDLQDQIKLRFWYKLRKEIFR